MVIPHCPRIGSLQSSMVCCMSNLNFDYLEPWIMIAYRDWDVIVWYHLFPNNIWRCEEKKDRKGKYVKTLTTKTWYLGRVHKIRYKYGNKWTEYWHLLDLHNQPFNMDIRLCWFQTQGVTPSYPLISMHTHTLKTYLSRGYLPCKKIIRYGILK